jgi:hypothetical protein
MPPTIPTQAAGQAATAAPAGQAVAAASAGRAAPRDTVARQALTGGLTVTWILGDDPRTITTKEGEKRTVLELRDPRRLSNSLVIWLDGEAESLPTIAPGTLVTVHVQSVRSGRARGELVGSTTREAVEKALDHAGSEER